MWRDLIYSFLGTSKNVNCPNDLLKDYTLVISWVKEGYKESQMWNWLIRRVCTFHIMSKRASILSRTKLIWLKAKNNAQWWFGNTPLRGQCIKEMHPLERRIKEIHPLGKRRIKEMRHLKTTFIFYGPPIIGSINFDMRPSFLLGWL